MQPSEALPTAYEIAELHLLATRQPFLRLIRHFSQGWEGRSSRSKLLIELSMLCKRFVKNAATVHSTAEDGRLASLNATRTSSLAVAAAGAAASAAAAYRAPSSSVSSDQEVAAAAAAAAAFAPAGAAGCVVFAGCKSGGGVPV
eukprot:1138308-Pelagomonas_calceolata.AAC.3